MMLWLRHVRALQAIGISLVTAGIIRLLISMYIEQDGTPTDIAPLWLVIVLVIPLTLVFTRETQWDCVAVRPVARRRLALLIMTVAVAAAASFLLFPGRVTDYGALAMLRNSIAMLGVGLLSLMVLPRWAVWVSPAVVGILSMTFLPPYILSPTDTLWAALRTSGTLTTAQGRPDLSWWLCLGVFAVGAVTYMLGVRKVSVPEFGRRSAQRRLSARSSNPRRGVVRAMLLPFLVVVSVVVAAWSLVAQLGSWGGSVRLLALDNFPFFFEFMVPVVFCCAVVAGQYRWRSSVAVWEHLSGRPDRALAWSAIRPLLIWLAGGVVAVMVLMMVVAVCGALVDGVDVSVILDQLGSTVARALVVIVGVTVAAITGCLLGRRFRGIWLAPVGLIVTAVLGITVMTNLFDDDQEDTVVAVNDDFVCRGTVPEVCADPEHTGYLDAAVATTAGLYEDSAFKAELPARVVIVDNGFWSRSPDGPVVGLSSQRNVTAPDALDEAETRGSLQMSIADSCGQGRHPFSGTDRLFDSDPDNPGELEETLRQVQECFA